MNDDEIFRYASSAIIDAKRVIEKAEAALQSAAQFERDHDLSKDAIEAFMKKHLSSRQREEVDLLVQKNLQEIRDAAEQAVDERQKNSGPLKSSRMKMHI